MKTVSFCAAFFIAAGFCVIHFARAAAPVMQKQYIAKLVFTQMKDGKQTVIAEPTLMMMEAEEANFLAGGEAPVDSSRNDFLSFGTKAQIKVREIDGDKLRVSVYASQSNLVPQGKSDFTIPESGVHCVRTVKAGEKIEFNFGSAAKGAAVSVCVAPAK